LAASLLSTLSRSLLDPDDPAAAEAKQAAPNLLLPDAPPYEGPTGTYEWARMYRRIDNRPFSLANFRPLEAIYADEHPNKVIGKPAQRGASEYAINYTGFALDRGAAVWTGGLKSGLNVAYIFPKKEALGDFSKERLTGLISESDYLASMFGDDDYNAITFKQVRDSFLYLRGGWSSAALKSFPADVLILDEFDEMASGAIALARRRLNASLVRRELALSTPSIPMKGIHALYLESDRHVYEQLHRCGEWVRYDFLRDVRADGQPYDVWQQWPAEQIRRVVVTLECPRCGGAHQRGPLDLRGAGREGAQGLLDSAAAVPVRRPDPAGRERRQPGPLRAGAVLPAGSRDALHRGRLEGHAADAPAARGRSDAVRPLAGHHDGRRRRLSMALAGQLQGAGRADLRPGGGGCPLLGRPRRADAALPGPELRRRRAAGA
jgi:hypothetical protein